MPKSPKGKCKPHGHNYGQTSGDRTVDDSTGSPARSGSSTHCGKKCGAGIGAGFGGLILLTLIVFLFLRYRRRNSKTNNVRGFAIDKAESNESPENPPSETPQNEGEEQEKDAELGLKDAPAIVPSIPEPVHANGDSNFMEHS